MARIFFMILVIFILSACSFDEDIYFEYKGVGNVQVKEVDFESLVQGHPDREERLVEFKELEDARLKAQSRVEESLNLPSTWYATTTLNVRSAPSASGDVIGQISAGDGLVQKAVQTDELGESWVEFEMEDGNLGYVSQAYLSKNVNESPIAQYQVVIPSINIRSTPSEEGEILGELGYFQIFDVYELVDTGAGLWLRIKIDETGQDAYVISNYTVDISQ